MNPACRRLAILGGEPCFEHPLHVGLPSVGDAPRFLERAQAILESRRFTNFGPYVAEFERRIAGMIGVDHCIATCNATSAISLTAAALGVQGSVVVPGFTFIATAHALHANGLRVCFADIDPDSHHLAVAGLERAIAPDTTAVVAVNLWGHACRIDELERFCRDRDLKLIFDSAQAFGSTYRGVPLGRFGDAEVFSFHATKAINSFEGGAITTNDAELAARLRLMINFGFSGEDCIESWGTNAKMPEICAAMGLTSLEAMDDIFQRHGAVHALYAGLLSSIDGLNVLREPPGERSAHHYVVVRVEPDYGLSRDQLLAVLRAENILARRYFYPPCHKAPPYRNLPENVALRLPATEEVCSTVICLPTGPDMSAQDVRSICAVLAAAASQAASVRRVMPL